MWELYVQGKRSDNNKVEIETKIFKKMWKIGRIEPTYVLLEILNENNIYSSM